MTVTTPGGTSGTKPYTYDPVPTITSLSRTSGPTSGGTKVTIAGTGFSTASHVKFGTTTAVFTVNSSISITATAPAHRRHSPDLGDDARRDHADKQG